MRVGLKAPGRAVPREGRWSSSVHICVYVVKGWSLSDLLRRGPYTVCRYMAVLDATHGGAMLESCSQTGSTGRRWHHFRALSSCFH